MVDPIVSKMPVKGVSTPDDQGASTPVKSGESKFDQVRTRLQEQQVQGVEIPPEVKQVSSEQIKTLETDLHKRLQQPGATPTSSLFAPDLKRSKIQVDNLTSRVNALPKTPPFDPLRQRLTAIDSQYQSAGKLIGSIQGNASSADLMKIQLQMYQLSENLELMSKVVEQVTSGVKSILQTQL
jgi:hypothetical protein